MAESAEEEGHAQSQLQQTSISLVGSPGGYVPISNASHTDSKIVLFGRNIMECRSCRPEVFAVAPPPHAIYASYLRMCCYRQMQHTTCSFFVTFLLSG